MKKENIKILITGDFCPIHRTEEFSRQKDYEKVFQEYFEVLEGNHLNVVDLECPLTLSNRKRPKTGPHQKAHPHTIELLKYARIDLAAMSNNHIMDYGSDGIRDTLNACHENGIGTVGVGKDMKEAATPYTREIEGKTITFFNYADNEFLTTPDGLYTCNPIDPISAFYDISHARVNQEIVIVVVHGGNEFYELPSPRTKKLYRYFIDAGADVVVAHHTHVFSGYEVYKGNPIFYGLGNFLYDWPGKIDSDWNRGYSVRLNIGEEIKFDIIGHTQNGKKPGIFQLSDKEQTFFQNKLASLNEIIQNDELLEKKFEAYCQSVYPMYDAFIEPGFGRRIASLRKRGLFPKLLSRRKRLFLLNLSRCDSHREVLMRMLKQYE